MTSSVTLTSSGDAVLPELSTVYQVIKTLYHDASSEAKENASKWLGQLQGSVYAWKIADDLLIARFDVESCYFAAQTLRSKIQNSFHELPVESYSSLKDSIIHHLQVINESVIQTQLALAITYLAILVPSWTNPVEELVSKDLEKSVIIEVLTLLPEELDQSRHQTLRGVGANRREQFKNYLSSIASKIMTLLANNLQEIQTLKAASAPHQDKIVAKIYRCLGAWLPIIHCEEVNLTVPVLNSIFASLKDVNCSDIVHDAASDTICGAALICESFKKYKQLTMYLLDQIYQLEVVYHHSVANEDVDKSVNYGRLFTEIAESVVDPLIMDFNLVDYPNGPPGQKLVDLMLDCVGHYDYEVAEITFHFWYRFSELATKKENTTFAHVVNRLLAGLTRHCQLESDQDGLLNTESELYDFRLRVRDLAKEVVFIVGASNYLKHNHVLQRISTSLASMFSSSSHTSWEMIEAELFILSCIVKDIYEDNELVSQVIALMVSLTSGHQASQSSVKLHPQVLATSCVILGELSDWLEKNPTYLDSVLNYLLTIITTTPPSRSNSSPNTDSKSDPATLSSIAAAALQPIIASASRHLVGNLSLVSILIQICSQLDVINNESAAHNLLQCCSTIISTACASQTRQQQEELVVQLLTPHLSRLKAILESTSNSQACLDPIKNDHVIYLDRIAAIFRNLRIMPALELNLQSPLNVTVTEHLVPLISTSLQKYSTGDSRVIERTCRCLRFVIRCLRPFWMLENIATVVCSLYQQFPKHSSYLYLASILVDEFAGPEDLPALTRDQHLEVCNGLIRMLNAFCETTFNFLTAPSAHLRNHPDTIDDFFRLCTRFLQKRPEQFLRESMLNSVLDLSIAALNLDHREANNSVTKFLIEMIEAARSTSSIIEAKTMVTTILNGGIGQRLTDAVINAALFNLPSYLIPEMSDILWQLVAWDRNQIKEWLSITLKNVATHNKTGVVAATPQQLEDFYKTITEASNPKTVAQNLRNLCRLYR
ncbi:Transportin-3 [Halotydeus destructor]|nr:Transportin-3 [Halotydeus destructor]